jgi:hypothetical protein
VYVNGEVGHVETIPVMGERKIKESGEGVEFNYDVFL